MNDNRPQHGSSGNPDAASWFVRLERDPQDAELRQSFETWLAASPQNRDDWSNVGDAWTRMDAIKDDPAVLAARAALKADLVAQRRGPPLRWAAGIAAAVVLGGGLLAFGSWRQAEDVGAPAQVVASAPQALAVYSTPVGGRRTVTLKDGSQVTLSTDTEVRLTNWDRQRALTVVKGEAFFQVAKNADQPFVVTAAGRTVTALGTAFDVRVDPSQWSVSLVEGKIRVASERSTVDMTPGHHLSQQGEAAWTIEQRNVADLTSWRDGSLVFENRPLASIVEEMNRYSTQKMRIADPALAATPLSGRFKTGDVAGFVATLEAFGMAQSRETSSATIDLFPHTPG